jgi:phosphoribosylformylglycinamidine cyclo-ligase
MMLALDPKDVDSAEKAIEAAGETAYIVGEIASGEKGVELC